MTKDELIGRLKSVKTKPELDALRMEVVDAIHSEGTEEAFDQLQGAFIKAVHRLRRIPLRDRTW